MAPRNLISALRAAWRTVEPIARRRQRADPATGEAFAVSENWQHARHAQERRDRLSSLYWLSWGAVLAYLHATSSGSRCRLARRARAGLRATGAVFGPGPVIDTEVDGGVCQPCGGRIPRVRGSWPGMARRGFQGPRVASPDPGRRHVASVPLVCVLGAVLLHVHRECRAYRRSFALAGGACTLWRGSSPSCSR